MSQHGVNGQRRESEASLRQIIEGMPDWVQVCDLNGTIQMANPAAATISGYDLAEIIGQPWPYPWFPNTQVSAADKPYGELYRTGYLPEAEVACTTKQGLAKTLGIACSLLRDEQGQPQHILMVARDLTERKQFEADLRQAQKMQAMGQLAARVAHHINNDLAVILGFSEFLLSKFKIIDEGTRQALETIQKQSWKCADTVRRIQLFARPLPQSDFAPFSVNEVVREAIQLTEPIWRDQPQKAGVRILVHTDLSDLPPVYGEASAFKEALQSIISNAVDALPNGGVISFKTSFSEGEVVLAVTDSGIGISPVHLNRVFDPFFTTKGPANPGLGLSIAYNLITQQRGTVSVKSEEGQGATFTVRLPAYQQQDAPPKTEHEVRNTRFLSVLVVDDEPMIVEILQTMLESAGHRVTTCLCGQQAVEVFQQDVFDLAVVDLGMPEMDGWEVSRRLNQIRPGIPIIMATGWNVSAADSQEQMAKVRAILKKPFGMEQLTRAIATALQD